MEIVLALPTRNRKLRAITGRVLQKETKRTKASRLHPLFLKADTLSHEVIAAAIEVHRDKGPGLNESIYEWCMGIELGLRGITSVNQKQVKIAYKGFIKEEPLRFDLLANDCLLVEAKSVEHILPVHKAQLLTYMKLLNVPIGLLINFNVPKLTEGLHRLMLPGSNR